MSGRKDAPLFHCIKALVRVFYPRMHMEGLERLPEKCIIVGNHSQMNGPIVGELYIPEPHAIWCAGEMMKLEQVPAYAYADFWSEKPKWTHGLYRLLSYLIAPLSVCVFNNANTIPVYRDARIIGTYRESIRRLEAGERIIIFPECREKYNGFLYQFQSGYIDTALFYTRRTHEPMSFVPMYIAPKLKRVVFGAPIEFRIDAPIHEERERINRYLMDGITRMACALPPHTVVPYMNISKRKYPQNVA